MLSHCRKRSFQTATLFACVLAMHAGLSEPASGQLLEVEELFGGTSVAVSKPEIEATLSPREAKAGDDVRLSIRVLLPAGSYTYSQDPSFSQNTKITVSEAPGLEPIDDAFRADREARRGYEPLFKANVEKYEGEVTLTRRYRLNAGVDPSSVYVRGQMKHLVCDRETCKPYTHPFAVSLTGSSVPPLDAGSARDVSISAAQPISFVCETTPMRRVGGEERADPLRLRFVLSPEKAKAGDHVSLSITMDIDEGWHSYGLEAAPKQIGLPTVINVGTVENLKPLNNFGADHPPELSQGTDLVYHGRVTLTRAFEVERDEPYGLSGTIKYMVCDAASQCKPPKTVAFTLGDVSDAAPTRETAAAPPVGAATGDGPGAAGIPSFKLGDAGTAPSSLVTNLVFAFLGGLILNVMPCVLPVLAIKILSFVQQAGEGRGRIFALNIAYAAGVIAVFLVLASLAVFAGKGWGQLFQDARFNLIMACVIFAMGLSLLGVFEIPVPGMVGSAAGGQHREGLPGACLTGVFATLLATPCTGPFMGATLFWSLKQPAHVVYLVWGVMGLGMASPYLVIGAFPQLVKWLPKPGMWMVRFKEFAGFVLMGAVVWLISFTAPDRVVPLLVMLVGIALGLWMIGNLYDHATPVRRKLAVRAWAVLMAGAVIGFGYSLQFQGARLQWQPFSTAQLQSLLKDGRPVLIDFTADWCLICKQNETLALNTRDTIQFVEEHGVVPLYADYTHEPAEIREWLERFQQDGVPLTVIFPAGRPTEPILLRGPYTQGKLLAKLKEALENIGGAATATETVSRGESHTSAALVH